MLRMRESRTLARPKRVMRTNSGRLFSFGKDQGKKKGWKTTRNDECLKYGLHLEIWNQIGKGSIWESGGDLKEIIQTPGPVDVVTGRRMRRGASGLGDRGREG